ncbi:efflux RND transporter periplasmic adaptor subunit [Thalassotalea eurytherma]|uniref:Copper transporter n=1 Tax=Thalassotalea eurytherma TaxID=1144278 RepID=A0ABQ6H320_9GAMM|nr:efflux RND transporter periplasmic adaptor subunit [Thalassotalea eurytherma]GLX81909.1 copper transporter [Thalassotalea eurytherma]
MNTKKIAIVPMIIGVLAALMVGILMGKLFFEGTQTPSATDSGAKNEPLYWVAPMDANYRRDKPGKSPMGMDLVPVYDEPQSANDFGEGVVEISSSVVNNLGVRTAIATQDYFEQTITTVGIVKYDEDKLVHIHPRVDGWIEKLYVKTVGDPVVKNQALYTLYSPELVGAQEEYLIALNRKNNTLIQAAKARLLALQLSEEYIERLRTNKKVSQTVTFYAPQSGVLDDLKVREGFYVKPGNTLMSIGQLDEVWVEGEVFERDASLIVENAKVDMTLATYPGKVWQGDIEYIYPSLNAATRTLRVRLSFVNADRLLKPNMFTELRIKNQSSQRSVLVPKEAVIRTGQDDRVVLALGQGRFKSVNVTIGHVNHEVIEILEGINSGDEVVVSAQFLLDSESSISSDFLRMMPDEDDVTDIMNANVDGVINKINIDSRILNISREAIVKWNREAETMDFVVASHINLSELEIGQNINFTFEIRDEFVVVELVVLEDKTHDQHKGH